MVIHSISFFLDSGVRNVIVKWSILIRPIRDSVLEIFFINNLQKKT